MAKTLLSGGSKNRGLRPTEIAYMRRRAFALANVGMSHAGEVLLGKRKWSQTQLRLFNKLLDKVMPDLHHTYSQVEVEEKRLNELSREDLMEIAAMGSRLIEAETIEENSDSEEES